MVENAELATGKRGGKIKEKRNLFSNYRLADVNSEQVNLLLINPIHTSERGQCQQEPL